MFEYYSYILRHFSYNLDRYFLDPNPTFLLPNLLKPLLRSTSSPSRVILSKYSFQSAPSRRLDETREPSQRFIPSSSPSVITDTPTAPNPRPHPLHLSLGKDGDGKSSGLISPNLYAGRKITIPDNWVVLLRKEGEGERINNRRSRGTPPPPPPRAPRRRGGCGNQETPPRYSRVSAHPRA